MTAAIDNAPRAQIRTRSGVLDLAPGRLRDDLPDASGYVVVRTLRPSRVPRLDGRALETVGDGNFIGDVRLIGDSSYHELLVYEQDRPLPVTFAFCTARATRRSKLVREMMEFAGRLAAVPEQLFMLGALGEEPERVPGVLIGWLTEQLPEVVATIAAVGRQPVVPFHATASQQPFAVRPDVEATRRLIRANPRLLQERENGPVTVAGRRYTPEFAVDRRPRADSDSDEHRQILAFARQLLRDVAHLAATDRLGPYAAQLGEWERELRAAISRPLWRLISDRRNSSLLGAVRTSVQRQDRRYSKLFDLLQEYRELRVYEPADDEMRTILEGAPRIFQSFVAYTIADALGLTPVGSSVADREGKASFTSDDARLYYDVKPPAGILKSWRDASSVPEQSRPDIVVASRTRGVLLLDAKFKDYDDDGDLRSDLREMHVYHDTFGVTRSGIVCPFSEPTDVAGSGRLIRVIRLRPVPFTDTDALRAYVLRQLASLFNAPI